MYKELVMLYENGKLHKINYGACSKSEEYKENDVKFNNCTDKI